MTCATCGGKFPMLDPKLDRYICAGCYMPYMKVYGEWVSVVEQLKKRFAK